MGNLVEGFASEKKALKLKVNNFETYLTTMERNHALGKIREDIFNMYWTELLEENSKLLNEYEKLDKRR